MAAPATTLHQPILPWTSSFPNYIPSSSNSWRHKNFKMQTLKQTKSIHLDSSSSTKFSDTVSNIKFDIDALAVTLEQCAARKSLQEGTQIHAHLILLGLTHDVFLSSKLLYFYSYIGEVDAARLIFDATPLVHLNQFFWNTMIRAYVDTTQYANAVELFSEMIVMGFRPNEFTYPFVLKSCSQLGLAEVCQEIHGLMVVSGYQQDVFAASALLDFYAKCGLLGEACKLFDRIPQRSLVTWNSMISGYAQNGYWAQALEAMELMRQSRYEVQVSSWNSIMAGCVRYGDGEFAFETLRRMMASKFSVKPNAATFNTLLPVISSGTNLVQLKELHGFTMKQKKIIDFDSVDSDRLCSSIASGYASHGCMVYASLLYNCVRSKNNQLWISMISGFVDCGKPKEAFLIFRDIASQCVPKVETLSKVPLTLLLPECSSSSLTGLEIHAHAYRAGLESNTSVKNALIAMYARIGDIEASERVFFSITDKDIISWNTMISNYAHNHDFDQAFKLFHQMHFKGMKADEFTFSSVLSGCGEYGAFQHGMGIHGYIIRSGFSEGYVVVQNALADMYGKCGCVEEARKLFNEMTSRDNVSWNTIISSYGVNARPDEVFSLFNEMQEQGWNPNRVTFIALLSACSHVGLVDEALYCFQTMTSKYGIIPDVDHYACIVDNLARAGRLDEAYCLIRSMPIKPDDCVWSALLSGCWIHGNVLLAEVAARYLIEMKPQNSGYHVLLSNIYRDSSRWNDAVRVRAVMKDKGVKKFPGYSWIEVNGECHKFFTADKSHRQSLTIYYTLDGLTKQLKTEVSDGIGSSSNHDQKCIGQLVRIAVNCACGLVNRNTHPYFTADKGYTKTFVSADLLAKEMMT
ncbi:hypothetical protein HHK36_025814 [Tetracentron sinense]|uniref:Pentatricopeptide repeat-containing protein n=1 Tax=Tetracentron sinense TaxID=13715 RepID=A0A835D3H1_TETSI|nr:hypothetical protein HHK36_025814 [Tetracentron sinense]